MSSENPAHAASIRDRAQAPNYAAQALEAVVLIQQATSPPQLLDSLAHATAAIGATGSVYTAAIPEDGQELSCFSFFACHPAIAKAQGSKPLLLSHRHKVSLDRTARKFRFNVRLAAAKHHMLQAAAQFGEVLVFDRSAALIDAHVPAICRYQGSVGF